MVNAVGSSLSTAVIDAGHGRAALEAQLAQYKKKLSDCVNCDSAKTTKGKAEIQELSGRINEIKASIEKVADAKSSTEITPKRSGDEGALLDVYA